jgi:hypothetical protein
VGRIATISMQFLKMERLLEHVVHMSARQRSHRDFDESSKGRSRWAWWEKVSRWRVLDVITIG